MGTDGSASPPPCRSSRTDGTIRGQSSSAGRQPRRPHRIQGRIGYVPKKRTFTRISRGRVPLARRQLRDAAPASRPEIARCSRSAVSRTTARAAVGVLEGLRQKIRISAARLHDPDLIVLDEPCSGLDVTSTLILKSFVRTLSAAGKMFSTPHVREVVEQGGHRRLILNDPASSARLGFALRSCWRCRTREVSASRGRERSERSPQVGG